MGGTGSGNRHLVSKRTTDEMLSLDINYLQRHHYLQPDRLITLTWRRRGLKIGEIQLTATSDHLVLRYRTRAPAQAWQEQEYPVAIERTLCHYGGCRAWFLCPRCGRRVGKLFGGTLFACRHCHRLNYDSQRENDLDRLARRLDKIRARLGWESGVLNGHGLKPKGMHRQTYDRLRKQHDQLEQTLLTGIARQLHL